MKKIIGMLVLITFLGNNLSYGLGVAPMSHKLIVMENAEKMMRVLWTQKRGPGSDPVTEILKEIREKIERHEFVGEAPQIEAVIGEAHSVPGGLVYPLRISGGVTTDIVVAARDFCRTRTAFADALKNGQFSVAESSVVYDRENGEIPIARLEGENIRNCRLAIHSRHRAEFKDILEHDVWLMYKFDDGVVKSVSVAEGFFDVTIRHYLRDIEKDYKERTKTGGHLVGAMMDDVTSDRDANNISGRYSFINDAIKLWFLASYSFNDTTRYNNNILAERLNWFYENKEEFDFKNQFPNINDQNVEEVFKLVLFINYHYFNRNDENGEPVKVREFEDIEPSPETENVNVLAYTSGKDNVAADKEVIKDFIETKLPKTDSEIWNVLRQVSEYGRPDENSGGIMKAVRRVLEDMVFAQIKPKLRTVNDIEDFVELLQNNEVRNTIEKIARQNDKELLKERIDFVIKENLSDSEVFCNIIGQKKLNKEDEKYLVNTLLDIDNSELYYDLVTVVSVESLVGLLREDDMVGFIEERIVSHSEKEEDEKIARKALEMLDVIED